MFRLASISRLLAWAAPFAAHSHAADCPDATADAVLGQPGLSVNLPNQPAGVPSAIGLALSNAAGVAVSSSGRLYASDPDNNRVLSWPSATQFSSGAAADMVFGQPDFVSDAPNDGGVSGHSLWLPQGVFVDHAQNLWFRTPSIIAY